MAPPHAHRRVGLLRCSAASSLIALCLGAAVIAVAVLVPAVVQRKLHDGILDTVIWRPDSPALTDERFRNNSGPGAPPDVFKVWLFNITNIDEVRAGGLPKLEQVGPYVHRVLHEKHDVLWDAQGRVFFKDYTHFQFDASASADPDAPITTFNLALLGVLANLHGSVAPQYQPFADVLMQTILSYLESDPSGLQGVFTTRRALDLVWGYEDRLLALLNALLPPGTLADGATVRLLRNASSLDEARARAPHIFNTGLYDKRHIWNAEADQGRRLVTAWPCDPEPVHGSDASQFQPGLTAASKVEVFIADLFQARRLVVHSTVDLHGVELLRFRLDPAQDTPNACRDQELRGLMNITTPQAGGFNASGSVRGPFVFVSMPMFCGADARLAAEAGLMCDEAAHQTWVDVEPITGITMRVAKRLMMSSRVGDLASVLDPSVRRNLTLPMFWAEEAVAATPELAAQFKAQVYRARWAAEHLGKLAWVVGGLLLLLGVVLAVVSVELAADPEKWPGRSDDVASLLASARAAFGGAAQQPPRRPRQPAGAGDAEQPLLAGEGEGAAAQEQQQQQQNEISAG